MVPRHSRGSQSKDRPTRADRESTSMRPTEPQSERAAESAEERVDGHSDSGAATPPDRGFPVFKVSEGALPINSEMVRRALDDD